MNVLTQTITDDNGITYRVLVDGLVHWGRRVAFGGPHDVAHRAGGRAFVEAARDQEAAARGLQPEGELVEEYIDATLAGQARVLRDALAACVRKAP